MTDDERAALEAGIRAALATRDFDAAATTAITGYGDEILRYLVALSRDQVSANDAFSQFCENVWVGLPRFRGDSTFRVWAYALARHALYRVFREPHRRAERRVPLSAVPSIELAAGPIRARTAEYLRTETKHRIDEMRASLDDDDRALLALRVNRKLDWNDIVRALADPDEDIAPKELAKRAANLRKRFQRIKDGLRAAVGKDPE